MRWVNQYNKEGNVNKHYRKHITYKVKKEYVKYRKDYKRNTKRKIRKYI
jgi:hypothetical protein